MGRIPDHLVRLAVRALENRWVTIGAKPDSKRPGKKKGGTPVELDGEGKITKGPAALTGKRPSELSQSHLFSGQDHKSQRKMFAEPGDPPPPPAIEETPKAPPPAAKKEPKPRAKKPQSMSLMAVIRREGGISSGDFEHADFKEFGLLGALNKKGLSLDDMAATLVRQGHMTVPMGKSSPSDHLLQLLKKKTNSLLAADTAEYDKDYEAYMQAREEAQADGHEEGQLEEVRGRGEEAGGNEGKDRLFDEIFGGDGSGGDKAGRDEEPGDLAGDSAEPASGVDTSFDFGPAAAPKVEEKPKAAKPRKPKQKKDWEDRQEEKHQKALADIKAADAEKAAIATKARELLAKVRDPGQKAQLQKLIDQAEGKAEDAKPEEPTAPPPAVAPKPATPPPALNLFGQPEPTKPQPATTQGLFGEQVPVEDPKLKPRETVSDQAEKGLDWLYQKQDQKTDGTGEMFGGLFSPGRTSGATEPEAGPVAPPKVATEPASQAKVSNSDADKHVASAIANGDADEYWEENQDDPKFTRAFNQSKQQFLQSVSQAESGKASGEEPAPAPVPAPAPTAQADPQKAVSDNQEIPKPDYQSATGEEIANYMGQFNGYDADGRAKYGKALQEMPKETKDRFFAYKNEQEKKQRAEKATKTKANKKSIRQELQGVTPELQPTPTATSQSQEVPAPPPLDTTAKSQSGYVNARASSVGNMGEDLPQSIRARRGADKNQNLATIDKAIETHGDADLGSKLNDPKMAMSVLAAHLALKALPKTMSPVSKKYSNGYHPYSLEQAQADLNSVYDAAKKASRQALDQKQDAIQTTHAIKNAVMAAAKKINNESPEGWRRYTNPVARHIIDNTDKQLFFRNKNGPFYKSGKMFEEFLKNNVDGYDRSRPLAFYADQATSGKWADSVRQLIGGADAAKIGLRTKKKLTGFKSSDAYLNSEYKRLSPHPEFTDHNQAADFLQNQVGLRGKNFGNTMSDRERVEHLNKAAGAFQDLADVTGLPQRAVSMNGKLALGLGSHGHGGFDAHAATYFPSTKVMNLTRKAGIGSLAHEWAHALDHELGGGKTEGGASHFLTSQKTDTPLGKAFGDLRKTFGDWENRMRNSDDWKYLNGSKKEYWKSPVEMFARAFEKYAQHKLAQSGRKNNYLSGVGKHDFWPNDEDMAKIAPVMDKVLELAKGKLTQKPTTESARIRAFLREAV